MEPLQPLQQPHLLQLTSTRSPQASVPSHYQARPTSFMSGDYAVYACLACAFLFFVLLLILGFQKYQQRLKEVRSRQPLAKAARLERLFKLTEPPKHI